MVHHGLPLAEELDALGASAGGRRKRGRPELQAQAAVVEYLTTALPPGTVIARVENAAQASGRTPQQRMRFHQMRKRQGMCPGFPDLACFLPGGRTFLVEMKAANGVLDARQEELHAHLRSIGHPTFVARCVLSAADAVRAAGLTPRRSRLDPA